MLGSALGYSFKHCLGGSREPVEHVEMRRLFLIVLIFTLPVVAQETKGSVTVSDVQTTIVREPGRKNSYPWKLRVAATVANTGYNDLRKVVLVCDFKTPKGRMYSQERQELKIKKKSSEKVIFVCLNQNPAGGQIAQDFMDMLIKVRIERIW